MKKIIIFLFTIVLVLEGLYYYYEQKNTEVLLSGRVIGFDIENIEQDNENRKGSIIDTSLKSIGTVTFINKDDNSFAALGHSISNKSNIKDLQGKCYSIDFGYVKKANSNKAGKIIADLNENEEIGELNTGNQYGIYGNFNNLYGDYQSIQTENRFKIKTGTAYILINVDGYGIQKYEVEIKGINYIAFNRNIRIQVTSDELIKLSGGIVRGMSGAPLIQNDKLIGAINCVNENNPLDAYAIFIDKLVK